MRVEKKSSFTKYYYSSLVNVAQQTDTMWLVICGNSGNNTVQYYLQVVPAAMCNETTISFEAWRQTSYPNHIVRGTMQYYQVVYDVAWPIIITRTIFLWNNNYT